jgi:predicted anti-sigma-YlaC factor YlaD
MALGLRKRIFGGKSIQANFREISSDYVDGEVTGDALRAANVHLGKCGPCRTFLDTLKATVAMMKRTPVQKAPPNLQGDILERLKRQEH